MAMGFLGGSAVKNLPANAGDIREGGLIGLGRSPGGEHGNPLQYLCLDNPLDREAWQATLHRVSKSWTQLKRLGDGQGGLACCNSWGCKESDTTE